MGIERGETMKLLLGMMLIINIGFAHKLNIFLSQEQKNVFLSAYFASGAHCQNCEVTIKDNNNVVLQEGKTNAQGEFIITKTAPIIKASVDAGGGHMVESTLSLELITQPISKNLEFEELQRENERLKSEIALLKNKNDISEMMRILFALLVVAGIFALLKRIKR